ncbi:AMP-binding protein [Micromonospora sp. NPDC049240]|uniref:AMP-binding protein n=1 Tax=Micromonospora sp. NPDC049240 TaxID=3155151 RepID=UPI0034002C62
MVESRVHGDNPYRWLVRHATTRPDVAAVADWNDAGQPAWLSYRDVHRAVDVLARGLWAAGVRSGDLVLIALPNDHTFVVTLLACVSVGAIAVPAPTPAATRSDAFGERIRGIVADAAPRILVTTRDSEPELTAALNSGTGAQVVCVDTLREHGGSAGPIKEEPADCPVAVLQYTSGSTGRPKGIVVTHQALVANCRQAARAYDESVDDVGVTWAPLYHDMGLVTGVMRPLFSGYRSLLMQPRTFARSPGTWLKAIAAVRGTVSSAPNFAYELCVRKVPPAAVRELDLSCWRLARNAGEVVRAATVDRFTAHFAAAGFAETALCPAYGLAEATLTVTTTTATVRPHRLAVRRADLERGRVVLAAPGEVGTDQAVTLLSSGVPLDGTRVNLEETPDRLGPIVIAGPQLASGYWEGAVPSAASAEGPRPTGDVGIFHDGQLFVLGRDDDTLVFHGRKFFVADLLLACVDVPELRPGRIAPFVSDQGEAVCVIAELRDPQSPDGELRRVAREVKRTLYRRADLLVQHVAFVGPLGLPVTTSGKVRVSEVRRRFEAGTLPLLTAVE